MENARKDFKGVENEENIVVISAVIKPVRASCEPMRLFDRSDDIERFFL